MNKLVNIKYLKHHLGNTYLKIILLYVLYRVIYIVILRNSLSNFISNHNTTINWKTSLSKGIYNIRIYGRHWIILYIFFCI